MVKERQRFFICNHCGNIATLVYDAGKPLVCCNEKMVELVANTEDASYEKHVPAVSVDGKKVTVKIGSVPHPMTEAHHITWVYIQSEKGGQRKNLLVNGEPEVTFMLTDDDKFEIALAYCNLHGLWKASAAE